MGLKCGLGGAHRSEELLIQSAGSQVALATVKLSPRNRELIELGAFLRQNQWLRSFPFRKRFCCRAFGN